MYFPGHFEPEGPPTAGPSSYTVQRPWSPINYDEDVPDNRGIHNYFAHARSTRRSEDSVEALDLADYSTTLRRATADRQSAYPPFPHTSHVHPLSVPTPVRASASAQYPEYPPSPDTDRPFSAMSRDTRPFSAMSRDTFAHAPSLVSGTTHESHETYNNRRPYSLPPFFTEAPQGRGPAIFSPHASNVLPHPTRSPAIEEDISGIPGFARGWYDDPFSPSTKSRHTSFPPYPSESRFNRSDLYPPDPSAASGRTRQSYLPWDSQRSDVDGPAVDDSIKEERYRMLEREFGRKGKGREESGPPMIGSVDEKGDLITVGPKKRAGARWAQGILALGAAASSLYGALFIKLPAPAPPASRPPAFALYAASVVTFVLLFYFFAIRPCFCGKRRKDDGPAGFMPGGIAALPVQGFQGGKKKKKKGKKGKYGEGGDVHVNLIVDPSMFMRRQEEAYGSEDGFGSQASAPPRRNFAQGMDMERDWIAARTFLKRIMILDVVCLLVWAAVFVFILLGKKCPPGTFGGWCDSYNVATAAACLLSVAFGFSIFFGVVDLHMSKASPRTRT